MSTALVEKIRFKLVTLMHEEREFMMHINKPNTFNVKQLLDITENIKSIQNEKYVLNNILDTMGEVKNEDVQSITV